MKGRKHGEIELAVQDIILAHRPDPVRQADIRRNLDLSSNQVSHVIRKLEGDGKIEKGYDGRNVVVRWKNTVSQPADITEPEKPAAPKAEPRGGLEERVARLEDIVGRIMLVPPEGTLAGDLMDLRKQMVLGYNFPRTSPIIERLEKVLFDHCGIIFTEQGAHNVD